MINCLTLRIDLGALLLSRYSLLSCDMFSFLIFRTLFCRDEVWFEEGRGGVLWCEDSRTCTRGVQTRGSLARLSFLTEWFGSVMRLARSVTCSPVSCLNCASSCWSHLASSNIDWAGLCCQIYPNPSKVGMWQIYSDLF